VLRVTDSTGTDLRRQNSEQPLPRPRRPERAGLRGKYLPSAQVVEELGRLGPDLGTIADELRSRLTEPDQAPRA
jgi:hypothetical protein